MAVTNHNETARGDAILGSLLGTAVGDALGLPYEGLSRRRAERLLGAPDRHRFVLGRGMVSDDTEHTVMVGQSLIAAWDDVPAFRQELARRLKWWLLGLPAGVGFATLRATVKLWLGISPRGSGVFSAGNGPAMRSAILGAAVDDLALLRRLVRASTRITHTDPKAEYGAMAVAIAAYLAARGGAPDGMDYLNLVAEQFIPRSKDAAEQLDLLGAAVASVAAGEATRAFAASVAAPAGVSGYVYHTVPVAIHAWLSHADDYDAAVQSVICCGGDTDTTAAIVGGIVGAAVGREGIRTAWIDGLCEWPRSVRWLTRLAEQLTEVSITAQPRRPPRLPAMGIVARNLAFLGIVLVHVARRMFPPY